LVVSCNTKLGDVRISEVLLRSFAIESFVNMKLLIILYLYYLFI